MAKNPDGGPRRNPYKFYGGIVGVVALGLAVLFMIWGVPLGFSWLIGINAATFGAYGLDKALAGTKRTRIPELVLLGAGLFGGTPAAWAGMQVFKHKRRKGRFMVWYWGTVVVQTVALILWWRM